MNIYVCISLVKYRIFIFISNGRLESCSILDVFFPKFFQIFKSFLLLFLIVDNNYLNTLSFKCSFLTMFVTFF